jgi:hypothetical protein
MNFSGGKPVFPGATVIDYTSYRGVREVACNSGDGFSEQQIEVTGLV